MLTACLRPLGSGPRGRDLSLRVFRTRAGPGTGVQASPISSCWTGRPLCPLGGCYGDCPPEKMTDNWTTSMSQLLSERGRQVHGRVVPAGREAAPAHRPPRGSARRGGSLDRACGGGDTLRPRSLHSRGRKLRGGSRTEFVKLWQNIDLRVIGVRPRGRPGDRRVPGAPAGRQWARSPGEGGEGGAGWPCGGLNRGSAQDRAAAPTLMGLQSVKGIPRD